MLAGREITVRFGGLTAIDAMSIDVPERGIFALVGPNGAGKTTLVNVMTRVCPAEQGTIELDGVNLLRLKAHEVIAHGVARSFQHAELFPSLSVLENVLVGLHAHISTGVVGGAVLLPSARAQEGRACERAELLLRRLGLWHLRDATPTDLPYGLQKLLDVARALVSEPKLLLLDEPFAGLSESEAPQLVEAIVEAGQHCAVLMIEHHMELVMRLAQRVTVMNFGRKISEGPPEAVRADPEVIRCYLGKGRSGAPGRLAC